MRKLKERDENAKMSKIGHLLWRSSQQVGEQIGEKRPLQCHVMGTVHEARDTGDLFYL